MDRIDGQVVPAGSTKFSPADTEGLVASLCNARQQARFADQQRRRAPAKLSDPDRVRWRSIS